MKRKDSIMKVAAIVMMVAIIVTALYIMVNGLGLQDSLDFGAGSYYYADIPEFDRYLKWDAFKASLPYWVYVLLFLLWGVLMYRLWKWIDRR